MALITEDHLEQQSLGWFREMGYTIVHGPQLAPDGEAPERENFRQVVLTGRLHAALTRLNPQVPTATIAAAVLQLANPNVPGLLPANRQLHRWMTTGLPITSMDGNQQVGIRLKVIGFDNPAANNWLLVNQLAVQGNKYRRRLDVVVYLNGLPVAVVELKNPADEKVDIWAAFNQLQTYKTDIPELFRSNVLLVISNGIQARVGSLSAPRERFQQWRMTDSGQHLDPLGKHRELETLIRGLLDQQRLLEFIRSFCLFEEEDGRIIKKIAAYHQFYAVRAAVERVVVASKPGGDRKGGVVWHTQGAGKSIEMACLAGKLLTDPRFENPTLVMVTDRQDLDGQLFGVFAGVGDLLPEKPQQAESGEDLRDLLANRPSGGIIFTTIQKFAPHSAEDKFPTLSHRHNVVVICDEAHRTQYGFKGHLDSKTGRIKYGLAKALRDALPKATFLAFTGTPISRDDRDTQAIFGNYVSIYDIQQAVEDGATVPIYYESRLVKLAIEEGALPSVDEKVDEIFEDENDIPAAERAKSKWAALEAIVGAEPRLKQVAEDLVAHHEQRCKTQPAGKAMVVAMSRDICARLYKAIVALRPHWHDPDHMKGAIKVVMTASASDAAHLQPHHTTTQQKKDLERRFKDPADSLKMVLVRDMWLTGFDAPCMTTMYVDKPMQGANIIQAIARVNRVFNDKPGGLVVDTIGIAPQLTAALATYTAAQGKGKPTLDISEAIRILKEQIQIAKDILHPVDWRGFRERGRALELIPRCLDHILGIPDGKQRFCDTVLKLTKGFALCGATDEAMALAEEVAFLQAVRAPLIKRAGEPGSTSEDTDLALRQLLSKALVAGGVTDIFKVAGLKKPDVGIMSDQFLAEVRKIPQKNLAVELLQRLIKDALQTRFKTNLVKQKRFSELLRASLNKYANRAVEAAQVIEELIAMAKMFREEQERGNALGLSSDEQSFYDALADNPSARKLMQDQVLATMAKELAEMLRRDVTIDWQFKENVRARLRVKIKTLLKRYNYPPDAEKKAIDTVLQQAEVMGEDIIAPLTQ